jgi:hypothetical protein
VAQEVVVSVLFQTPYRHTGVLTFIQALAFVVTLTLGSSTAVVAQSTLQSDDIGDVGVAGFAAYDAGVLTIAGAGADVWGNEDGAHFVHQTATDTFAVIARVDHVQDTNPYAKAGVMVRHSLEPDSATVLLSIKPNHELELMARVSDGGAMFYITGTFVNAPVWLALSVQRLEPQGVSIVPLVSEDNINWKMLGRSDVRLYERAPVEAGLFVSSHDRSTLNTAHFSGVRLLPRGYAENAPYSFTGWANDIGKQSTSGTAVGASGSWADAKGRVLVQAAGSDIWGTTDSFFFVHTPQDAGIPGAVAWAVERLDARHAFAKAGVMIRHGLDPSAESVILDVKPNGEVEFMARPCFGCQTAYLGGTMVTLPATLQLGKDRDRIYATVVAADGTVTNLGYAVVSFFDGYHVGLAVTSHDPASLATAVFRTP